MFINTQIMITIKRDIFFHYFTTKIYNVLLLIISIGIEINIGVGPGTQYNKRNSRYTVTTFS